MDSRIESRSCRATGTDVLLLLMVVAVLVVIIKVERGKVRLFEMHSSSSSCTAVPCSVVSKKKKAGQLLDIMVEARTSAAPHPPPKIRPYSSKLPQNATWSMMFVHHVFMWRF